MNTKLGEISTVFILSTFAVLAVATLITTTLNKEPKTTQSRAAGTACPYDSGITLPLGKTESDANNAENRVPISQNKLQYDILAREGDLQPITDDGVLNLTKTDGGAVDGNVRNMMASMFGYKPNKLTAAYKHNKIGGTYVLQVPTDATHNSIKMPATGYDIGGGYEAMVVFAAADRVTLHIGRHEYFTGTKTCANGKTCSGGYWIYVKGICVDKQIVNAYNSVRSAQESAGANLNPIDLPMVRPGHILGKVTGASVLVAVRDNGPLISIFKPDYWGGVPQITIGGGGNTATPAPTSAPLATSTPTPISCQFPSQQLCSDNCLPNGTCTGSGTCWKCDAFPDPTATSTPTPAPTSVSTVPSTPTPTTAQLSSASSNNEANTTTIILSNDVYLPACAGNTLADAARGIGVDGPQECIIIDNYRPL